MLEKPVPIPLVSNLEDHDIHILKNKQEGKVFSIKLYPDLVYICQKRVADHVGKKNYEMAEILLLKININFRFEKEKNCQFESYSN